MTNDKYAQAADNLCKAIDVAVQVFEEFPPKELAEGQLKHIIDTYLEFRNNAKNPAPQYRNLKSLSYDIENVFIYFQEGSGKAVNVFWDKIKELNLPYKRENKLAKILKRKKIKNDIEYDFIIDVLVPYQQEKLIDENDVILLNQLIEEFENRTKKGK
jgi:hypothetical protein